MIHGFVDDDLLLELMLGDGDTGMFPRATVYNAAGALQATIDLTHTALGLYQGVWANPTAGHFSVALVVYSNAGHTTVSNKYDRTAEHVLIVAGGGIA
jgi:hypothetical protein